MKLPVYFVSHGGGPWPYIPEMQASNARLAASLADIPRQIGSKPNAILMVSAHWETRGAFAVMGSPSPSMLYDYYGFPAHTYEIQYPAPGSPELAGRVAQLLSDAGLAADTDTTRGFDHGAFVPAFVMYPEADVPMVQLSIDAGYDPALHLSAGRALAPLRKEGVLIVGSGLSYHNLRQIYGGGSAASAQFDAWLQQVLLDAPPEQRAGLLERWTSAPAARLAHPREDHLIPLMVAAGAAESDAAACVYHESQAFAGITASSFRFG
ncbi:DODA-type extradiol aromatic ring-opening family dioxygenase [Pollutimonas bauzanensis]|uniref:Aromatic ring-opening dioxygenase, catalytic subunit, LigB family n=1 Tax=Pollutimonas bauzanensis TaxID=658167 RepID=A0A1M5TMV7_9BURK|nr:class III extradiol ring-cleavage dioxygenase [Pollutimonas bauzanensis]SHH51703.1 Aromatic ring-opening dioxygenase, catalytic subunit, LigB family [Pollutimonas bauzanensis]